MKKIKLSWKKVAERIEKIFLEEDVIQLSLFQKRKRTLKRKYERIRKNGRGALCQLR